MTRSIDQKESATQTRVRSSASRNQLAVTQDVSARRAAPRSACCGLRRGRRREGCRGGEMFFCAMAGWGAGC